MAKREKFQKTNAMRELERAGVSFTYQEFEEDDLTRGLGLRMALEAGVDPASSFKTLVTVAPSGTYVVCCIPVGEELDFKVIEFVKETKRIILSHSRTFEEGKDEPIAKPAHKRGGNGGRKNETPAINNVAAGTSLGDIDALAKLKAQMEGKA